MSDKSKEVSEWLKVVLGDHVPWFEVNKNTIDILHKLSKNSQKRCRETDLLVEEFKLKNEEYKSEGNYHQDVLDFVLGEQVSFEMQEPLCSCLNSLVGIAEGFKLKDTKLGSLLSSSYTQTQVLVEEEEKNMRLKSKLRSLDQKRTDILKFQKSLEKTIADTQAAQDVEAVETDEKLLKMDFLRSKYEELSRRIKTAQDQLISRGVSTSLTHHSIKELSEQLALLKQEIEPLKKKMMAYHGLPHSIPLARLAVAECEGKLKTLDAILDEKIDWSHT